MIQTLAVEYSVKEMSEAYEVSASGYYQWFQRQEHLCARQQENQRIVMEMRQIHSKKYRRYGSPKMTEVLRRRGYGASHKRVARLMRSNGLRGRCRKPFRPQTTDSSHGHSVAPNRLAEVQEITAINQVWVSDITYIATKEGWLFLAAIMDLFSRHIVGWGLRDSLNSDLAIQAQQQALRKRRPAAGWLCHSDRGVQYTSQDYRQLLKQNKGVASMSRKGNCYDNAALESFWSLLKSEALPDHGVFETKTQAKLEIFEYIEAFYNRERLHSSLGYKSPIDFEAQHK